MTNTKKAFVPKILRAITLPLIKPQLDVPVYVLVMGTVFLGKEIAVPEGKKKMDAAHLINVTDLETGELAQMIVPSVLKGIFADEFKDDSYVGKGFMITKHPKGSGKDYHPFSVSELDLTE
jgi:hypothetical protein